MIFFDYYFRDFSIPKVLVPLADCMKNYQGVIVADLKAFNKVVDELKENYNAIPKAEERFSFHVSEGSLGTISVYKNNSQQKCMLRIYFSDVRGMFGFDSSQESIQPVPDDGDDIILCLITLKVVFRKGVRNEDYNRPYCL